MKTGGTPNIFLSWSGALSGDVATLLRETLPKMVPDAVPWLSREDIAKGTVWPSVLNDVLRTCCVGIFCLTPENLTKPWLLFEAGAIFKALSGPLVCTLACGIETPLTGPLAQFQLTLCQRDDMARLIRDIHKAIGSAHSDASIEFWFNSAWPDFEKGYQTIRKRASDTAPPIPVPDRALLEEVLATVRPFRQFQESMGETLRSRVVSIEWYEPFSFDLGLAQATRIQKQAIGDFLKIQMRDPAKAERLLKAINDDPATEAYSSGKGGSSEHRAMLEDLTVTWEATYSRGLDASMAYITRIQRHDPAESPK